MGKNKLEKLRYYDSKLWGKYPMKNAHCILAGEYFLAMFHFFFNYLRSGFDQQGFVPPPLAGAADTQAIVDQTVDQILSTPSTAQTQAAPTPLTSTSTTRSTNPLTASSITDNRSGKFGHKHRINQRKRSCENLRRNLEARGFSEIFGRQVSSPQNQIQILILRLRQCCLISGVRC